MITDVLSSEESSDVKVEMISLLVKDQQTEKQEEILWLYSCNLKPLNYWIQLLRIHFWWILENT